MASKAFRNYAEWRKIGVMKKLECVVAFLSLIRDIRVKKF